MNREGASKNQAKKLALLAERAAYAELRAKANSLKGELVLAQKDLKRLNDSEFEITQLEREIEIQRASYRNYADKLEQARIDRALETEKISNISIVQPPYYPTSPVSPNKPLNLGLGLFMGIFGGLGLAFVAESRDHSLKTSEDVHTHIDVPLLSALPYRNLKKGPGAGRTDRASCRAGKRIWNLSPEVQKDYLPLINHLLMSGEEAPEGRVLALTSCSYGEGVSSIAANLAMGLAELTDRRVLLVDANLRQPAISRILEVGQSPGLAELLENDGLNGTYTQPSKIKNLEILASGRAANPEVNLFLASHTRMFLNLLRLWRREYHLTLIDLPALTEDHSGIRLASLVDGMIFVAEAEKTPWEVAQRTIKMLIEAKAKVLGIVLNKRRFHIPDILHRWL
jgi:succinoglycan biosynthesis transport protein ExoP